MRKQRAEHPSWTRDMRTLFKWITGRKVCLNAKGMMTVSLVMPPVQAPADNYAMLKNQQQRLLWRIHQSEAVTNNGRCCWEDCPEKMASAAKHLHSKASAQQRHTCALQGMQCISRKGCVPLQRLYQGCTSELPLALPHLPSQQGICINDSNKLIYLN